MTSVAPHPIIDLVDVVCSRIEGLAPEAKDYEAEGDPWGVCAFLIEPSADAYHVTVAKLIGRELRTDEIGIPAEAKIGALATEFVTAFAEEQGDLEPTQAIQIEFERDRRRVIVRYRSPNRWGSPRSGWAAYTMAEHPEIAGPLDERWNIASEEERQAQQMMRDQTDSYASLREQIEDSQMFLDEVRARVVPASDQAEVERYRHQNGDEAVTEWIDHAAFIAEGGFLELHARLFELQYTRGDDLPTLVRRLEEWHRDTMRAFRLFEHRAGTTEFATPTHHREYFAIKTCVDLIFVATVLGRADIAREILDHPAISHLPYRQFDSLAVAHGVPQDSDLHADRSNVWHEDPRSRLWLKVAASTPGRRQAAFTKFVRSWREELAKKRWRQTWNWEGAMLAVLFDLDDSEVRDTAGYPADLVDCARSQGVPALAPGVRLPGPWKKPTPPKVLEPARTRGPLTSHTEGDELPLADFATLLTPVDGDPVPATDLDALLDAAVETGTIHLVDSSGIDPTELGEMLQLTCRIAGLPSPGRIPAQIPKSTPKALTKFDTWLESVGVRLLQVDVDSGDHFIAPVLAADHAAIAGRTCAGVRLISADQIR